MSESERSESPRQKSSAARRTAVGSGPMRLQRILAGAGFGSRRHCEELILSGRVEVDHRVVTELGSKADPATQEIRVDGTNLPRPKLAYFAVNKPPGVVSTNADPAGRPRVIDLVPYTGRLFTVGRLDMSSEGLILVTNDGELALRLTHPRYGIAKTYQVEVAGAIDRPQLEKLRKGVHLAEGFARVESVRVLRQYKNSTQLEMVLTEGRNREVRRIFARVGHKVERLRRVAIGPLRLAELPSGAVRELEPDEVRRLLKALPERDIKVNPKGKRKRKPRAPKLLVTAAPKPRVVIGGDAPPARPSRPAKSATSSPSPGTRRPGKGSAGKGLGKGPGRSPGKGPGTGPGPGKRPATAGGKRPSGRPGNSGGRPQGGRPAGGKPHGKHSGKSRRPG